MLQIAEIRRPPLVFLPVKELGKTQCDFEQLGNNGPQAGNVFPALRIGSTEERRELCDRCLDFFPGGRDAVFHRVVSPAAQRLQFLPAEIGGKGKHAVPIPSGERTAKRFEPGGIGMKRFRVSGKEGIIALQLRNGIARQRFAVIDGIRGKRQNCFPPHGIRRRGGVVIQGFLFRKPTLRERMRTDKIVQPANRFGHCLVISAGRKRLHKLIKPRVSLRVKLLQRFSRGLRPENGDFPVVQHADIRRHAEAEKILPNKIGAKAVNRTDMRARQQKLLALEALVKRVFLQHAGKRSGNAAAHFGCRGLGEGHDKEPVRIRRMFRVGDALDNALYQDRCFSGTGGGGNKQCAAARADCVQLFRRPVSAHDFSPSFPVFSSSRMAASRSQSFISRAGSSVSRPQTAR